MFRPVLFRALVFLLLLLPLSSVIASPALAPGDLDTTCGAGGKVTTDFGGNDIGFSVAIQGDGRIVVAGYSEPGGTQNSVLARYTASGILDITFGTGGKVATDIEGQGQGPSVAVQPDGRIVVAGTSSINDFTLARYNADGSLDLSFGTGGKVSTDLGGDDRGHSIAIQGDGRIVVAGVSNTGGTYDFALARYNADGTLDTSFGAGGKVATDFGGDDGGYSVAVQGDGKIVVAGYSYTGGTLNFALARYNASGSLDASFGTGGKVATDFGGHDYGRSVAIQGDGRIVVAGYSNTGGTLNFALARYNASGSLDASFGTGGKVATDFGGYDYGRSVAIQGDGRIVVAGAASSNFAVARYNANGSLDASFGTGGKVTTDFGGDDAGYSVAIQSDGRIVVAGHSTAGGTLDFALARYMAGEPAPPPTPTEVLSPVLGPLRVTGIENPECDNVPDLWTFCQHQTGGHGPYTGPNTGGVGQADDTYAWDANLYLPGESDSDNGRPVFAVAAGVIPACYGGAKNADHRCGDGAFDKGTSGQVLIEHSGPGGTTWWSGYLHLKDIQVAPGQAVTESTVLGYISNTSPDPIPNHLHFVVYTGSNTEGGLRSFDTTIVERPSTFDLEVTMVVSVNALGGGIPVQGEPAVIEIGVRNVGNQSIPMSLADLFIAVEDLAGEGLADIPFVQRLDGADLFQAEIRRVVVPTLAPNATGTIRVGQAAGAEFAFLSAAYSDRLRVQLLFSDDNLTNNGGELAPLGILPSLDTALNCISEMFTVGLAPAAVGAESTAVTLTALGTDLAAGGAIDYYQLSSAIKERDVDSAANKVATQTLRLSRVGAQAVGKETMGKALGYTKLGWGVMNAAKNEANFSGCGEAFAIVPRMMGEMVKDLVRQGFIMLQETGQKIWLFLAGSPVNLIVEDSAGLESFATHDGDTGEAIPYSFVLLLDMEPKVKAVVVLGDDSYDIRVVGVDEGVTHLVILQPTAQGSLVSSEFVDIPTKADSVVSTTIGPQTAQVTVELDMDGDGVIDETRLPDNVETLVAPLRTPAPIPGLSQWGLIALALLLAGLGYITLRRRRQAS
ncbi:MAG: IPTL-CTERM sorting domain-containing protein [Chloroflexi bacterium]|nr:IPTL-CTERM sorting domain-containing protein [Chloroflexota bacterium]